MTKIAALSLACVLALVLAPLAAQEQEEECEDQFCKTSENKVLNTDELACSDEDPCTGEETPCYGKTVESWTQACAVGANGSSEGKECTTYSGPASKTTLRACVAGECVVTNVATAAGGDGNRCVTTDCPTDTD